MGARAPRERRHSGGEVPGYSGGESPGRLWAYSLSWAGYL